jgi:hypothetical protein
MTDKLDLSRYEGHTPGPWRLDVVRSNMILSSSEARASSALATDAPLLLAEVKRLQQALGECSGALETQEKETAALRAELKAEKARLDWCERQWPSGLHLECCAINSGLTVHGLHPAATVYVGGEKYEGATLRAAIDAAREKS